MCSYIRAQWGGGNVYSYLCRFLSFPLFFFVSFVFFLFSLWLRVLMAFSFSVRLSAAKLPRSPINFNFFSIRVFFYPGHGTICNVTPSPPPHSFSAGRWSTSGWGGNAHFFTATQEYDRGRQEKIKQTNKHEQSLRLTKSRRRSYATLHACAD